MRALAVAATAVLALGACGSDSTSTADASATSTGPASVGPDTVSTGTGITIRDPWSRQPADGQTASAVYGVVTNDGADTVTAVSATTDVTHDVELHETLMSDDGQMSMQEKAGGFAIAPGESLTFEPGGPHIMLLGVDPATYPDTVVVTLTFDDGQTLEFDADVRDIGADSGDEMGDMNGNDATAPQDSSMGTMDEG